MNRCDRPLDPIDAEALASGAEPVLAEDAAAHAASCTACGVSLERARQLTEALEGLSRALPPPPDLADRVTRLRAFSRRERRTYAFWRAPVLLAAGLSVSGLALLGGPSISAGEQAGLGASVVRPVLIRRLKQDVPGQLGSIARALGDAGINIETQYSDHANRLILVVDDMTTAERVTSDWAT